MVDGITCTIAALGNGAGVLFGNRRSTKDADSKCNLAHGMFSLLHLQLGVLNV